MLPMTGTTDPPVLIRPPVPVILPPMVRLPVMLMVIVPKSEAKRS